MAVNNSSSSLNIIHDCSDNGFYTYIAYSVARFLLLPLSILVLYLGYQRWQKQRSFATSHSDIFTYNSVAFDLIYALGDAFDFCGEYTGLTELVTWGYFLCSVVIPGQASFHILTCVERYLAVVHPVTYLGLRQSGGIRMRNISTGCVWLLCVGWIGITAMYNPDFPYTIFLCFLALALVVVSFCSLSILCVLIRPGPGEMGRNMDRVDQSKQRAFNTITAITGVLWVFFLGFLVCLALESSNMLRYSDRCLVWVSVNLASLPSCFVLPLLFLHRAGKLVCCHYNND